MEFAVAFRQAVQASGLTLERIRHRLGRRGLAVSVATLSYWQRGRSRPRSRAAVALLEEVLDVPPGTLTGPLDEAAPAPVPPRPGATAVAAGELWPDPQRYADLVGQLDRSGDHRLERLSVHDVYRLDEGGPRWALSVRAVLRASGDDVDRVVCVHRTGPDEPPDGAPAELSSARYCRPGRVRAGGGLMAFELVFDRVLAAGDTAVIEYELRPSGAGPAAPPDGYDRRFSRPVHDYVAVVQFAAGRLPARCYGFTADGPLAPRRRLGELWIGTSGSANIAAGPVRHGIVGVEWEWQ
ncbi:helix-turn-helix domain-containing protein [Actinomadura violacea]|uniref:Helix-turn-helix transcriptional regulator n=1 Tax=Actinomadura violacea TaxID=2819934 RepID=A0ABS3S7V2_9ACTN|nr:helix-turn-helix domain-containing protein [Actinomadura violacea]MBO2464319.1 helix-turn-helix transcriptional regulator [Actinomadura violacea]